MAKKQKPEKADVSIGGNVEKSVVIDGDNNVVNYYAAVSSNIEKHEPDFWALKHPYPMPPNFTGRVAERATLTHWLKEDSENHLFILRALGGFGKSALAWQWLTHDVDSKEWPKVLWWSFYEGDASFEHFIEETLKYLRLEVPQGQRPQVDELLKAMQSQKILLIMDGFERALRAYSSMNAAYQGDEEPKLEDNQLDCVNINAEIFLKSVCSLPNMKSKVLITTRLTPRAVKPRGEFMLDCHEEELTAMQKSDAVEFFHKQKIKGTHAEIEAACAPYGYHPLSLRLLAGRILKDFDNPADIVVAQKLKIDGDLKQHQHHVLEVSYKSLPPHVQKLLSTIACFRSPVELKTLEAIDVGADGRPPLQDDLHDLVERGLLHFDEKNKKFDLHPIVRRYTYERLTVPDRTAAHTHLRNYFAAVDVSEQLQTLEDIAPVIELYYHMVRAGQFDEAIMLFLKRLNTPLYFEFGLYQQYIELLLILFINGEDEPPHLEKMTAQAWTLNSLANAYSSIGQPRRAAFLFSESIKLNIRIGNWDGALIVATNMARSKLDIGAIKEAELFIRNSFEISNRLGWEHEGNSAHDVLGCVLSYCGNWEMAEQELRSALGVSERQNDIQSQGVKWLHLAQKSLFMARSDSQLKIINLKSSIKFASRALELTDKEAQMGSPTPYNYVRAYWILGTAYCAIGDLTKAEEYLSKAINLCRQINSVDVEADILLDLARLRYAQGDFKDAQEKASEALVITERSGYVLQGADVNLFLAELALTLPSPEGRGKARAYAETALKLAHCDDGPPYYYKVAYDEAKRFLENLK